VSRVLGELGQTSICIEICKKISTQPEPVVSRVDSRVSTHFNSSTLKSIN